VPVPTSTNDCLTVPSWRLGARLKERWRQYFGADAAPPDKVEKTDRREAAARESFLCESRLFWGDGPGIEVTAVTPHGTLQHYNYTRTLK
jgi:hypothetical protein